ncbi:MAG: DUF2723 domain-containing protein [Saprospiraceae bacterium]
MNKERKLAVITGWITFAIAMVVYFFSAESSGSLWDCGEFVLGAYKLQVVHPPGAPLFLIIGRLFTWVAHMLFEDPSYIAFSVNIMSGMCTALAAMFVAWTTMVFARLAMVGRDQPLTLEQTLVTCGAGLVAGLTTAFCTSVWFSAVEGEVYAMSTMFTTMTLWAAVKWYGMEDSSDADRWLIFAVYSCGLSIGVHLLSLLAFPAIGLLYYFKKHKTFHFGRLLLAMLLGTLMVPIVQNIIIVGLPELWSQMEYMMVNGFGFPVQSGIFPTTIILIAAAFFAIRWARKKNNGLLERLFVALTLLGISFSTIGVVVIRANANPPINMNNPSDPFRLIPYLNREQYGERPLLRGPNFEADPVSTEKDDRYGLIGKRYEVVDQKLSYVYRDEDKMLFPRISHNDGNRPELYHRWMGDPKRKADMGFNMEFFFRYQVGWMYWRYFMWNFVGRENGEQGFEPWNPRNGHWISGFKFLDSARLFNMSHLPESMKTDQARNCYYFIPLILGLIGLFYQFGRQKRDFTALLVLFLFTGLGIIIYSNEPPNEPRERDYVLVGSFITFCIWVGLAIPSIYGAIKSRLSTSGVMLPILVTVLGLTGPAIMLQQNFDDHSRRFHYASRDYASNFLESLDPNAIMFTYGDNDTYPLWYAQEVEGIRRDVRIVNLSLIAVDWYIDGLRRKINDSAPIKLTIPSEAYRGSKRNQIFFLPGKSSTSEMPLDQALAFLSKDNPQTIQGTKLETYMPSNNLYIPIDPVRALSSGLLMPTDSNVVTKIPITVNKQYITKDELAIMDLIMSNIYDRPIYFSVTCQDSKLMNMQDYTQMEGLGLRIIPVRSPSQQEFYIYGSGRVDDEKVHDRVDNKWRWGNFDKKKLFVDNSYAASIQAQKMVIWRSAEDMLSQGKTQEAVDITDKYFEGFPAMNFPYDARIMPHINIYVRASEYEKAKFHIRILAKEMVEQMDFFNTLDDEDLKAGFNLDYRLANSAISEILKVSKSIKDEAFAKEMEDMVGKYDVTPSMQQNK